MTANGRKKTIEGMNTSRPSDFAAALNARPFHTSSRTAMSVNTDPATGQRVQTMTTSRLDLAWVAGELRIACKTSRVQMDMARGRQRPDARSIRGDF
jgi:hypothetical protein